MSDEPKWQLQYPDLEKPPEGWTVGRSGNAIRLAPPGAFLDHSRAFMIVSPLVPRTEQMPSLTEIIMRTIATETIQSGLEVVDRGERLEIVSESGLEGVCIGAAVRLKDAPAIQQRAYVMYQDDNWLYAISYIADEETWDHFFPLFQTVASSILPKPAPTS